MGLISLMSLMSYFLEGETFLAAPGFTLKVSPSGWEVIAVR